MDIIIRRANIEDAHALAEAEREIAEEPGIFCSQPSELTDESIVKTIIDLLEGEAGVFLVAESEGQLVGHAFLEPFPLQSMRHIAALNIAVHRGWQDKGIGTLLMEKLIEWAKESETIEKIELSVRAGNAKAYEFYKKMGFVEEGRLKKHVKIKTDYYDDILMALFVK